MLSIIRKVTGYIFLITVLSSINPVAAGGPSSTSSTWSSTTSGGDSSTTSASTTWSSTTSQPTQTWKSYDKEDDLRSYLMAGYQQSARPDRPTVLTSFYSLRTLKSLDIAEEKMGTVGWLTLVWEDPRLTWNPDWYGGIETLEMTTTWRPNFFIANEIKDSSSFGFTTTDPVRVYNTGVVRWLVPLNIETGCDVDIALFPFDSQKCSIFFIYWITSKDETLVVLRGNEVHMEFYSPHGEWELTGSSDELEDFKICCPDETVQRNVIRLQFERRRPYYVINILLPTVLMSVCVVWTFLLPTESGERIGYSLTILLSFTVFLTMTNGLLPSTSKQTPTFATYLLIVLILSLLSVSLTVWNVKFHSLEGEPPRTLRRIFAKLRYVLFCERRNVHVPPQLDDHVCRIGSMIKVQPITESEMDVSRDSRDSTDDDVKHEEITWKDVSETLDRIYFFLFLASFVILNVALLVSLMSNEGISL